MGTYFDISNIYKKVKKSYILKDFYKEKIEAINYEKLYNELSNVFPQLTTGPIVEGDWFSSTAGWGDALMATLGQAEYETLFKDTAGWWDDDFIDGEIEARLDDWYKNRSK